MWPKVFTQLVELLPHITRLIPMADMFFQSKTASEKANEAALTALAKDVRTDLGSVTSAHEGLYRQLQAQGSQLANIAADTQGTRLALAGYGERVARLEAQLAAVTLWIKVAVVLLVLVLIGMVLLFLHVR